MVVEWNIHSHSCLHIYEITFLVRHLLYSVQLFSEIHCRLRYNELLLLWEIDLCSKCGCFYVTINVPLWSFIILCLITHSFLLFVVFVFSVQHHIVYMCGQPPVSVVDLIPECVTCRTWRCSSYAGTACSTVSNAFTLTYNVLKTITFNYLIPTQSLKQSTSGIILLDKRSQALVSLSRFDSINMTHEALQVIKCLKPSSQVSEVTRQLQLFFQSL